MSAGIKFTPRGGRVVAEQRIESVEARNINRPMMDCEMSCEADRRITAAILDPHVDIQGEEMTPAAFDAYR